MAKWKTESTHHDIAPFSPDPQVRAAVKKHRLIVFAIFLALCGIIGFGAKPAYRVFRNAQIDRNLRLAEEAARLEDWARANGLARSVLLARPTEIGAYRIWHKALANLGDSRTYLASITLFSSPRATREDRMFALRVLALQAPQAVAFSAYAMLSEEDRKSSEALAALAPLLVHRGETVVVENVLRNTPLQADPHIRLELVRVLCARPTEDRLAEARRILADLIADNASEPALEALLLIGSVPGGLAQSAPLPKLPEWVALQPQATTMHHLLALEPAIAADPAAAGAVFQQAIDRFLAVDPGTLGGWLNQHGRAGQVIDLLAEQAVAHPDAYIARLHALLREQRNAEIDAALADPPPSCDLVDLALAKVAVARFREDGAGEKNAWNEVLNYAAFDESRNRFLDVARYADMIGARTAAQDALVAAIRVGWGRIPLYADLTDLYAALAAQGRSQDLLAIYRVLLRFEPRDPELANNYLYLALLHKVIDPATAVKELENLAATHPGAAEYGSALAMAHILADRPEEALKLIPALQTSRRVAPMMRDALEGTALLLNGQDDQGRTILEKVNWRAFLECEQAAFYAVLVRLQLRGLALPEFKEETVPLTESEDAPAWRKAVENLEKVRSQDELPPLPMPKIPGADRPLEDSQPPEGDPSGAENGPVAPEITPSPSETPPANPDLAPDPGSK